MKRLTERFDGIPDAIRVLIPCILLLVYLAQCVWFIDTQSLAIDEPINIRGGLEQWRLGRFSGGEYWNDHPPLARLLSTFTARDNRFQILDPAPDAQPPRYPTGDRKIILPGAVAMAWHTRPAASILGVILGLLIWMATWCIYSPGAANLALALFAFSPSLIANFCIVGTDGIVTLMTFATAFQVVRWRHNQSYRQTGVLGLVLGGLLVSKFSALPLAALTLALVLILKPESVSLRPDKWNWKHAVVVSLIAFVVVWGTYFFHVTRVSADGRQVSILIPNRPQPIVYSINRPLHFSLAVPAYEYIQAIGFQVEHNREGHPSFLMGRVYTNGSKLYFPVTILLKWPTVVLSFSVIVALAIITRRVRMPRDFFLWAIFPSVFFLFALFTHVDIGERLVLPVYAFALPFCAGAGNSPVTRKSCLCSCWPHSASMLST